MKQDYYAALGVERKADAAALKRAYYTKVKQFPPERFPAEYKELRAAYDVLGNPAKRTEYDRASQLPKDAAYLLEQAREQDRLGKTAQVTEIYEKMVRLFPDLTEGMTGLARAYEAQRKTGKANVLWEKLCAKEPDNAGYHYELALGYEQRGWHKKAGESFRRSLSLDSGNADCWVSLVNCMIEWKNPAEAAKVCVEGVEALGKRGRESMRLYTYGIMYSARQDLPKAEGYLRGILHILQQGGQRPSDETEEMVYLLMDSLMKQKAFSLLKPLREIVLLLATEENELSRMMERAELVAEIDTMGDGDGYDALFHDLLATLDEGCDCEDCRLELAAMEYHILVELETYRPQLLRLKAEKPHLYAMHAAFFNEALLGRNTEKLLYQRAKKMSKKGVAPAGFGEPDSEEDGFPALAQTVRRDEPKVGRNQTCPCGSGKKYKKCCGR